MESALFTVIEPLTVMLHFDPKAMREFGVTTNDPFTVRKVL